MSYELSSNVELEVNSYNFRKLVTHHDKFLTANFQLITLGLTHCLYILLKNRATTLRQVLH